MQHSYPRLSVFIGGPTSFLTLELCPDRPLNLTHFCGSPVQSTAHPANRLERLPHVDPSANLASFRVHRGNPRSPAPHPLPKPAALQVDRARPQRNGRLPR